MIVEIYEIQTPEEAEKCIELGVHHLGSVLLSRGEWRDPVLREMSRLCRASGATHTLNPLFQDAELVYQAVDYYQPGLIHFCENLTDSLGKMKELDGLLEFHSRFKERFPDVPIMRSIPVPASGYGKDFPTLEIARNMEPGTDLFLIDTWVDREPVEGYIGITGQVADFVLARQLVEQSRIPVILAGGLSPENVYGAILEVMPAGADSCTQTNAVDEKGRPIRFQKDFHKVDRFVREAQRAEQALQARRAEMEDQLKALRADLQDREAALPAHSVRPHQIMIIEEMEEKIAALEERLRRFKALEKGEKIWKKRSS